MLCCFVVVVQNVCVVVFDWQVCEKVLFVLVVFDVEGKLMVLFVKKFVVFGYLNLLIVDFECVQDGKVEVFFINYLVVGVMFVDGLQVVFDEVFVKLLILKFMMYQCLDGLDVKFVCLVYCLMVLYDDCIVFVIVFGVDVGDMMFGYCFLFDGLVVIQYVCVYVDMLCDKGCVIVYFVDCCEMICMQLNEYVNGDMVVMFELLFDEVMLLVEWLVVYLCCFEDEFLQVLQECLIFMMQMNQKYFVLIDVVGKLCLCFLIVLNIEMKMLGEIIEGNECVVCLCFVDVKFFFEQDKKKLFVDCVL